MNYFLLVLLSIVGVVNAGDLIVEDGSLIISTNIVLRDGSLLVRNGGKVAVEGGLLAVSRDAIFDYGANLSVSGMVRVLSCWSNSCAFQMSHTFSDIRVQGPNAELDFAKGSGDTDGDGVSDYAEGSGDVDGNGVVDFLDPDSSVVRSLLPADWLARYGLPLDHSADDLDSDGDGFTNREEFQAGTAPDDEHSALVVTSFETGDHVVWNSVRGKWYTLKTGTNMNVAAFSQVLTNFQAMGSSSTCRVDAVASRRFYRVEVAP